MRRDPGLLVLGAALLALLGLLFSHGERITSDGVDHYVFLRSLAVDHDLDLANDYALVSPRRASAEPKTPLGRTGNAHPIGPAILWTPFYLGADLVTRLRGEPPDGWNPLYRDAVAVGSVLYGWAGLVLVYLLALPIGRGPALVAALGLGFGTFLYFYLAFAPTMAHAMAFAAAALVVWLWLSTGSGGPWRAGLLGGAVGLAALTRWSSALLALLPAVEAAPRLVRRAAWSRAAREALCFGLGFLAVFSPQLLVWRRLYGSFFTIPQGSSFVAAAPAWGGVLFSPHHGLFSWSPLLYLGAFGLALYLRLEPWRGLAALIFLLALARLNAGVADWWGGSAFGARRFDAALPLCGLGLALAVAKGAELCRAHPLAGPTLVVVLLVAWNLALAVQYRSGAWDYSGPVAFEDMGRGAVSLVDRALGSPFSLPAALWARLREGRALADYESLYMRRPHARWTVRMGLDERLFLEDGWSAPEQAGPEGPAFRRVVRASAGLVVPLHRPEDAVFGARLKSRSSTRCRVLLNDRVLGSCAVDEEWRDCALAVPGQWLRAGPNRVRLKPLEEGELAVAGAWLEPGTTSPGPPPPP